MTVRKWFFITMLFIGAHSHSSPPRWKVLVERPRTSCLSGNCSFDANPPKAIEAPDAFSHGRIGGKNTEITQAMAEVVVEHLTVLEGLQKRFDLLNDDFMKIEKKAYNHRNAFGVHITSPISINDVYRVYLNTIEFQSEANTGLAGLKKILTDDLNLIEHFEKGLYESQRRYLEQTLNAFDTETDPIFKEQLANELEAVKGRVGAGSLTYQESKNRHSQLIDRYNCLVCDVWGIRATYIIKTLLKFYQVLKNPLLNPFFSTTSFRHLLEAQQLINLNFLLESSKIQFFIEGKKKGFDTKSILLKLHLNADEVIKKVEETKAITSEITDEVIPSEVSKPTSEEHQ